MKIRIAAFAIFVFVGLGAIRWCGIWPFNGVIAVVRNVGSTDYTSCELSVTGRSYSLGPLSSRKSVAIKVSPTGESRIELHLVETDGSQHDIVVDCYFERQGYSGTITADIAEGRVVAVVDDIGIGIP